MWAGSEPARGDGFGALQEIIHCALSLTAESALIGLPSLIGIIEVKTVVISRAWPRIMAVASSFLRCSLISQIANAGLSRLFLRRASASHTNL